MPWNVLTSNQIVCVYIINPHGSLGGKKIETCGSKLHFTFCFNDHEAIQQEC